MKKIGKILLVSTLAILTVGTIKVVNIKPETLLKGNVSGHVQAYNHNPNNILDNVFEKDGMTILPFILKNSDETISKDYIVSQFNKAGFTIQNQSNLNDVISTGTQIKTNSKNYTVLIYGDADGDGYVDVFDAQAILKHYVFAENYELKGIYNIAANVDNEDEEIDVFDAQRILRFYVGYETKIVVNEPVSIKEVDKTAPDIKLNGNSEITLIVKDTYTEQGATATDNVDGDVTNNIKVKIQKDGKTVDKVDTLKLGTYVITYTVTDAVGNTASKTRKVIIKDVIDSIEISTAPNKVVYNYGENIDLTGTKIKANYLSGKVEDNIDISNASVTGYDSKIEGQQEILVTYKEKQISFTVTVLKKINGLEIIETGRDNVTIEDESDVYKTISKEQFVLGTIKEKEQEEGSKLLASQVQFITKIQITSSNSNVAEFEETDKLTLSINENNQIIGTAQEAGSYQIEAYIMYGTEKESISINLNAVKSTVIGELVFTGPDDDEVRYNNEEPIQKELKIKNINGEEIGILAKDVIITNNNLDKMTITKLNANKSEISEENEIDTEICYLEITTNSKVEIEDVSFKIEIANTNISKDIIFDIGEALGITSIKVTKVQEDGQTEVETTSVELGNEIGETILPIYFYNQLDKQMKVRATDVQVVNNQWIENNIKEDGKLYIVLPDVQIQKMIGNIPVTTQGIGIRAKLYDEKGIEAAANDYVAKIGFSLINNEEQKVIISSLIDKNIEFESSGLNKAYNLSMEVSYNSVTEINFSDSVKENIEVSDDDSYDYVIEKGNEFVLGSISVPVNEEITADMLKSTIISSGSTNGINIYFEDKIDGTVLVKGTASQTGVYEININLKDDVNISIDPIYVQVQEPVSTTITDIQIGQDYVVGNNVTITTINALSNTLELQIKRKDIEIKHNDSNTEITDKMIVIEEPENVEIELLDNTETPIPEGYDDEVISKISIQYIGTVTENTSKIINIVLYNNETPITKTLKIYASDVKALDIESEVTLYKTANTETVEYNGNNYSLMEIKGYLDEEKEIETVLKLSDFQTNGKIIITPDKISAKVAEQIPASMLDLVEVQYFDSNKNVINSTETNKEVAYVGFAIRPYIFNAEDLDGAKITVTCTTMENPVTVTINYTEN